MDRAAALELRIVAERRPEITVACITCGGRGRFPTASADHDWVPPTQCARCGGMGEEPEGVARNILVALGDKG